MVSEVNPSQNEKYIRIIDNVLNGQLQADSQGILQLPPELKSATANGKIFVTSKEHGLSLIAFPTWVGKGFNMQGFLYVSSPLSKDDIYQDYYGNDVIDVGVTELVIDKKLSENWFAVSRNLD